ncbi:MAG: hypothetical protein KGI09_08990, partial [Thaumarchaeota archaeon]|nr:hypothetical protein [Nitrososphaerota archaeon]
TVQATATITVVQLSTSNYAVYAGTLTMNYTDFRYTEGTSWNTGWQVQGLTPIAFSVKITNNNATSDFYFSKQAFFWLTDTFTGGGVNSVQFYIVNSTNPGPPLALSAYSCPGNDYCLVIPHGGGSVTVDFGAMNVGGASPCNNNGCLQHGNGYDGFLVLFGKFVNPQTGNTVQYGQNLPFVAVLSN